ncbi:MAG: pimelyl-ACP methyl ester esterase BioV [Sulfurovum sp.]|nr:pimelyl-ACP methyl ester esterase BioV [Sulfurovum sp.]
MKYFNGFSLCGEEIFFDTWLIKNDFCVAGFSYGAQKALEYTFKSKERIDRLILLSPAFFHNQKVGFVRAQLHYFHTARQLYMSQFLQNISYPSEVDITPYLHIGSKEELEELLTYKWDINKLQTIQNRGTIIEVFLGEKDKIVDAKAALDFFTPLATTYYIKEAGHLLKR